MLENGKRCAVPEVLSEAVTTAEERFRSRCLNETLQILPS
jgi:hypothetical protein